jgi:hypothetical protein
MAAMICWRSTCWLAGAHGSTSPATWCCAAEQDRTRWDPSLIDEPINLIEPAAVRAWPGPYQLEAAIAALHLLSPGAPRRGPGCADAADARRADHGGDRPHLPGHGRDDGQAPGAGQGQDPGRHHPVPGAASSPASQARRRLNRLLSGPSPALSAPRHTVTSTPCRRARPQGRMRMHWRRSRVRRDQAPRHRLRLPPRRVGAVTIALAGERVGLELERIALGV